MVTRKAVRRASLAVRWDRQETAHRDPYAGSVRVHASTCYDFLNSLRALYNPRRYQASRGWTAAVKDVMPRDALEVGRSFFQGHAADTGFGIIRMVPQLPDDAEPGALIAALEQADTTSVALYMLDNVGDMTPAEIGQYRLVLDGERPVASVEPLLRAYHGRRAERYRRILAEPQAVKRDLVAFLRQYQDLIFAGEVLRLAPALASAAKVASDTLAVLPTTEAIEWLTRGYAMTADLPLREITLAPSVHLYPFTVARVDEQDGKALIVFGVQSRHFDQYDAAAIDPDLVDALRAIADPGRLRVLRLLTQQPMHGPELVKALNLSQPAVHQHVSRLRAAELVRQERTRAGMRLTLRRDNVSRLINELSQLLLDDAAEAGDGTASTRTDKLSD